MIRGIQSEGGADLVVVDTLGQVPPGRNEYGWEDVGKALAHCRQIHTHTGATVLLAHHPGCTPNNPNFQHRRLYLLYWACLIRSLDQSRPFCFKDIKMKKTTLGSIALSLVACGAFALLSACGGGAASQEAAGTMTAAKPTADQTATTAAPSLAEIAAAAAAEGSADGNASNAKATNQAGGAVKNSSSLNFPFRACAKGVLHCTK